MTRVAILFILLHARHPSGAARRGGAGMAHKNLGSSHLHEEGDDASPSAGVIFCLLYWYKLLKTSSVYLVLSRAPTFRVKGLVPLVLSRPPQATEYLE